jgi:hypothetical protein
MSITSMTNRARMAENLTIDQLKQSIQDGVVPSYIGVPLLKTKVEDAKLLQAAKAAQSMSQQPSVAQQIMSQAQQVSQPAPQMAPQAGVEGLSTNLPAAMAGGGIVAFAEGGMYDEDDSDEDRQDAARQAEMDEMMDEYAQSFQQGIGQLPAAQQYAPAEGKEDTSDFIARIMQKESRGRRYGKDGQLLTSEKGAQGEMQVMPGTSRDPGFGVKPARDGSPDELARVGRDYANTLLARYGDPKLAAIAYNMGPGATDKWLAAGADISKLPKETQGYVKGFAGGGEVQHFATGALVYNPETGMMEEEVEREGLGTKFGRMIGFNQGLNAGKDMPGMAKAKEQVAAALAARNGAPAATNVAAKPEYSEDFMRRFDQAGERYMNDRAAANQATPAATPAPAPAPIADVVTAADAPAKADPYAKFEELFAKREENLAKQREQDKYMAMLQAGLGMMGGTSQHALANIGAGASQGIQSLAQSNKDRTAEENALLSGRLGLAKIGSNKEYQDAMMAYRKDLAGSTDARARDLAKAAASQKTEDRTLREQNQLRDDITNIKSKAEKYAEESMKDPSFMAKTPAERIAAHKEFVDSYLKRDETFAALYKKFHNKDYFSSDAGKMSADRAGQFKVER